MQLRLEVTEVCVLGAVGAVQGAWRYYVKPELQEHSGAVAWASIAAGVALYDVRCAQGQTLSETVDRGLERSKLMTSAAVGYTALHLLNVIPERYDLFTLGLKKIKGA